MHRTESANNVSGLFSDGPPATAVPADWLNAVQEELAKFVTQAGLTLYGSTSDLRTQVHEALAFLIKDKRSKFSWKDADEIYLDGATYIHRGTVNQIVRWEGRLTFQLGAAGSNSDSDNPAGNQWQYIYLDDSAIVTAGTNLISANQLLNVTTAPSWDNTKKGWYNGNDRCIFAVRISAGNVLEFFHDGDFVCYADYIVDLVQTDIDLAWTNVTLTMPAFATQAEVLFDTIRIDGAGTIASWRTDGQAGAVGHEVTYIDATVIRVKNTVTVLTSSSQIIEIVHTAANNDTSGIGTEGWYFPIGM